MAALGREVEREVVTMRLIILYVHIQFNAFLTETLNI